MNMTKEEQQELIRREALEKMGMTKEEHQELIRKALEELAAFRGD